MSSTEGSGNKLWNINLMEYITQTLKTNLLQNGKVFTKMVAFSTSHHPSLFSVWLFISSLKRLCLFLRFWICPGLVTFLDQ